MAAHTSQVVWSRLIIPWHHHKVAGGVGADFPYCMNYTAAQFHLPYTLQQKKINSVTEIE